MSSGRRRLELVWLRRRRRRLGQAGGEFHQHLALFESRKSVGELFAGELAAGAGLDLELGLELELKLERLGTL